MTLEQFISIVRESGLVGHASLATSLREVVDEAGRADPSTLADALVARGHLTDWQAEKLLEGVAQGFFLGKHKLLRLVASGSMSSVYEAEHVLMHRRVALKVLPKSLVGETSFLERFYREARAVARLDHPNIIRGFDVGQDGDYHYFVMEYVEGSTLQDLVDADGPLPIEEAAELIRQAALGLGHAHEAGLVHRDIKPANLVKDQEGTVKVLDLGLVRSLHHEDDAGAGLTRLHDECVLGTVDYLSPEQAIDSHDVDIRSDIYSLGCTLYFLLTGAPPFPNGTLAERLLAHQHKPPAPVDALRPEAPRGLCQIVARMLAKRPDRRFQTPGEVADVLAEWLHDRGESSTIPAIVETKSPPAAPAVAPAAKVEVPIKAAVEPAKSPARPLSECWERWAKVVESIASRGRFRPSLDEASYRRVYEDLLSACRAAHQDADGPTRLVLRRVEDLAAPWPTLRSLRSILNSEMSPTLFFRFHELDRVVRARPGGSFFRRLLGKVFAP